MSRYIDEEKLRRNKGVLDTGFTGKMPIEFVYTEDVDNAPTADVAEVKHGFWFISEYEYLNCSECGESYFTGADSTAEAKERLAEGNYYPYCPHCGAKMDGERRDDAT